MEKLGSGRVLLMGWVVEKWREGELGWIMVAMIGIWEICAGGGGYVQMGDQVGVFWFGCLWVWLWPRRGGVYD